jgi:pimeloyl-ACP methyl ester carboxylesterase
MSETDLVAVLPGVTGSALRHNGKLVWGPKTGAILEAIRTFGRSLKQLQLPDGVGDDHPADGVEPDHLIPDVHAIPGIWSPIRGYTALLRRLQALERAGKIGKVLPVPYDWRLSNRYNGQRLSRIVQEELGKWRESDPSRVDARMVFVGHSMGGLVARWYIEKCGGADVTRKLITLGTPYRGAARTIDQLANGVRRGLGPLAVDLTNFARSLPSSYQLLPDYACVEHNGALYRLDELSVPSIDVDMLSDALRFHRDLVEAEAARAASLDTAHAIVGVRQPTATTVRLTDDRVEVLDTIDSANEYGDATVPLVGAIGHDLAPDTNRIWRIAECHGHLQGNPVVLDNIESVITASPVRRRDASAAQISVCAPELALLDEGIRITVDIAADAKGRVPAVQIQLVAETLPSSRAQTTTSEPKIRDGRVETTFQPAEPGAYQIRVTGNSPGSVTPVTATVLVWGSNEDPPPPRR